MAQIALMTRYRTSAPHIGDKVEALQQTTASASCAAIPAGAESTVCHLLRCTYACNLFQIHAASCNLFQLNWSPSGDWAAQQYSKTALTDSAQLLLQGSRQMVWGISRQQSKEQGVVASTPRTWAQWRAFQFPTYKQRASGPPPRLRHLGSHFPFCASPADMAKRCLSPVSDDYRKKLRAAMAGFLEGRRSWGCAA